LVLVPEEIDGDLEDSDEVRILAADFEIGHMLRDSIVPKAVLYYTGEVGDEDDGEVRNPRQKYSMIDFLYYF
jgi:nucleosome assembly protein 1-like 1